EHLRNSLNRPNAHYLRAHSRNSESYKTQQRLQPQLFGPLALHHYYRRTSITALGRVPGGNRAASLEDRVQLGQSFLRGITTRSFISFENSLLLLRLPVLVHPVEPHLQRDDLLVKKSGIYRLSSKAMAAQCEGILICAGDSELPCHLFASQA